MSYLLTINFIHMKIDYAAIGMLFIMVMYVAGFLLLIHITVGIRQSLRDIKKMWDEARERP